MLPTGRWVDWGLLAQGEAALRGEAPLMVDAAAQWIGDELDLGDLRDGEIWRRSGWRGIRAERRLDLAEEVELTARAAIMDAGGGERLAYGRGVSEWRRGSEWQRGLTAVRGGGGDSGEIR